MSRRVLFLFIMPIFAAAWFFVLGGKIKAKG